MDFCPSACLAWRPALHSRWVHGRKIACGGVTSQSLRTENNTNPLRLKCTGTISRLSTDAIGCRQAGETGTAFVVVQCKCRFIRCYRSNIYSHSGFYSIASLALDPPMVQSCKLIPQVDTKLCILSDIWNSPYIVLYAQYTPVSYTHLTLPTIYSV